MGAPGDFRFSLVTTGHRNSPAFDLIGSRGAISFDMERAAEFNIRHLHQRQLLINPPHRQPQRRVLDQKVARGFKSLPRQPQNAARSKQPRTPFEALIETC